MKLEYMLVYENSSDNFNIEHHWIKVKVTVGIKERALKIDRVNSLSQLWIMLGN